MAGGAGRRDSGGAEAAGGVRSDGAMGVTVGIEATMGAAARAAGSDDGAAAGACARSTTTTAAAQGSGI